MDDTPRYFFNNIQFGALVHAKRGAISYHEAARRLGSVKREKLKHIEAGYPTDVPTFVTLCNWIHLPPAIFFVADGKPLAPTELVSYLGSQIEELEREVVTLRALLKKFENRNPGNS